MSEVGEEIAFIDNLNNIIRGKVKMITATLAPKEVTFYHLDVEGVNETVIVNENEIPKCVLSLGEPMFNIGQTVGIDNKGDLQKSKIVRLSIDLNEDAEREVWYALDDGQFINEEDITYAEPYL